MALSNVDEIIALIKAAPTPADAKRELMARTWRSTLVEEMLAEFRQSHPQLQQTVLRIGTILGERVDNQITALFEKKRLLAIRGDGPYVPTLAAAALGFGDDVVDEGRLARGLGPEHLDDASARQAADPEMAEEGFGGDVREVDLLLETRLPELVRGVEEELVRRAEAACALRGPDDDVPRILEEPLPPLTRVDGVLEGRDREGVAVHIGDADLRGVLALVAAGIEARCREKLASFKIARRFETIDKLPRNALGKVQKHLLCRAS